MRDKELLEQYLRNGSEAAFTELVNRYVDLAYSVAQRQLSNRHLAEEVVQSVFCLLARKAPGLMGYENLAGWIYKSSYHMSLKTVRDERKRRDREHAIADMHLQSSNKDESSDQAWDKLSPLLDEALNNLNDSDRSALVLRFIHRKGMREVGIALGTSEAAAKMRVSRAIEKLRGYFLKRNVSCSSAALTAALGALSIEAAPAGLTATVAKAALLSAASKTVPAVSLAQMAILMAKLKTKYVLVGLGTSALFLAGGFGYSYLLQHSLKSDRQTSKISSPSVQGQSSSNLPQLSGFEALKAKMGDKLRDAGIARATAKLKAALNLPPRKGTRSYPSSAMADAILAFGSHQNAAFQTLKEALESGSEETRLQAIAGLGMLGTAAPEAKPLLWNLLQGGDEQSRFSALSSLGNIGFEPQDLPRLADMIPGQTNQLLVRYLPEQIARAIQRNPEGMKSHIGSIEALLNHTDPNVRFSGAAALAESRGTQDPQILKGLADGLAISPAYKLRNEGTGEVVRHLMAIETLQRIGSPAKTILPELQEFANNTPDSVVREAALRAIGTIDSEARQTTPEVNQVLAKDERQNALWEKLQSGTFSPDDLAAGLANPLTVSLAASRYGELGSDAKNVLPELHKAIAGKDEATRDEILASIKKIDPDYTVERIPRAPVSHGALAAQLELEMQRSKGELNEAAAASLEKVIDAYRMGNTSWYTRDEIAEFAEQLRQQNPRIYAAFLSKAEEQDPNFQRLVQAPHSK